jgi:outer membrane biosynthesis protein TonB
MGTLTTRKEMLRREIATLLEKVAANRMTAVSGNQPEALDSLLKDLFLLTQKTVALQSLLSLPEEEEKVIVPPVIVPPPVVNVPPVTTPAPQEIPEISIPEITRPEPVAVPETKRPEPAPVVPEIKSETPAPVVPEIKRQEPAPVVPETKAPEPVTRQETAIKQEERPASGRKFADIRSLIGFNEKLMFQRYLFGNDNALYEDALNRLNSCSSAEEAAGVFSALQQRYSWNMSQEPVQIFSDTVKRRFA